MKKKKKAKAHLDTGAVLVCARRSPGMDLDIVPGSVRAVCSSCLHSVVVAPTGLTIIEAKNARVLCMECAFIEMKNKGEWNLMLPTKEQFEELDSILSRAKAKEGN